MNFQRLLPLKDSRNRFKSDYNEDLILEHEIEHDNEEQQPGQAKSSIEDQMQVKFNGQQKGNKVGRQAAADAAELMPLATK